MLKSLLLFGPLVALARYQIYRNATVPVRMDELICSSAHFVGSPEAEDLNDTRCQVICAQDCWMYQTKNEIAKCLEAREALNCLFEWYEGYSVRGRGCDDNIPGNYPLQLDDDPELGLHASMADRGMAWIEVMYHTNKEHAGSSMCITGSTGYVSLWFESQLRWEGTGNTCVDRNGTPTHYVGYSQKDSGLPTPLVRHDYSYTLGFNITEWLARAGNALEGNSVLVLQASQCWGSYKRQPGLGGVVVQKRRPLTDFTMYL